MSVRNPGGATVPATWVLLVEGSRGWTALPRLAAWLCVPALIAGAAAGVSEIARAIVPSSNPLSRTIASSAGGIAMLFGMAAMFITPVAAVLVLVVSLRRRWRFRVVCMLWFLVTVAMGNTLPSIDATMRNWLVLQGAQHSH